MRRRRRRRSVPVPPRAQPNLCDQPQSPDRQQPPPRPAPTRARTHGDSTPHHRTSPGTLGLLLVSRSCLTRWQPQLQGAGGCQGRDAEAPQGSARLPAFPPAQPLLVCAPLPSAPPRGGRLSSRLGPGFRPPQSSAACRAGLWGRPERARGAAGPGLGVRHPPPPRGSEHSGGRATKKGELEQLRAENRRQGTGIRSRQPGRGGGT